MSQRLIAVCIAGPLALILAGIALSVPLPYASYSPGPTFDILGKDENQAEVVTLSALTTDLDFSVRHSGKSLDLRGRVTINQQHDLIGEDLGGPGDRNRVSYAYFDVDSAARDWSLRFGRQTLRSGGVLGRFDGAHAAYEWSDGRRVLGTRQKGRSGRRGRKQGCHHEDLAVESRR